MLKYVALGAIRVYQTVLSPYKGFRCAYAACTGCASCSVLGYRAIRRFGLVKGINVLRWRFAACSEAYVGHLARRPLALGRQRGDCDCGGCDSLGSLGECACDLADCGKERKRRRREREPGVTWLARLWQRFRRRR